MTLFARFLGCLGACFAVLSLATAAADETFPRSEKQLKKREKVFASSAHQKECDRVAEVRKQAGVPEKTGDGPHLSCAAYPSFPPKCMKSAAPKEHVKFVFDITPQGRTENIRIAETTNECFNKEASDTVFMYLYSESEDGFQDVETTVLFQYAP